MTNRQNGAINFDFSSYYYAAVNWATENGIVLCIGEGFFASDTEVTREQIAAILWRYAKFAVIDVSIGENTNILSYNDSLDVSEYAIGAIQWTCGAGIISGKPSYSTRRAMRQERKSRLCCIGLLNQSFDSIELLEKYYKH